jgi:hypothetical protein
MAHVADVDRSAVFYALLGFGSQSRFSGDDGVTNWSAMASGDVRLFLARANAPVIAEQQAMLFYMCSADAAPARRALQSAPLRVRVARRTARRA